MKHVNSFRMFSILPIIFFIIFCWLAACPHVSNHVLHDNCLTAGMPSAQLPATLVHKCWAPSTKGKKRMLDLGHVGTRVQGPGCKACRLYGQDHWGSETHVGMQQASHAEWVSTHHIEYDKCLWGHVDHRPHTCPAACQLMQAVQARARGVCPAALQVQHSANRCPITSLPTTACLAACIFKAVQCVATHHGHNKRGPCPILQ